MPLHPQVQAHLDRLAEGNFAELHTFPPEQIRAGMRAMTEILAPPEAVTGVEERQIDTTAGELSVRVYHPAPKEQLPGIVFFHGGGFVLGDLDTHDGLARALANAARAVVVSVDYPLAPEHRYPAAPRAAFAAIAWVAENAATIGIDASRLAVAGDSAGGNLAAVVAMQALAAGGPKLAMQVLIYPDLDFRRSNFSIQEFAGKYGNISRATQFWFMDQYLSDEAQKLHPLVSPLLASNLEGLPRTMIVTAEYDALRDEGEEYGARLRQAGVPTVVTRYDGMIHEFIRWPFDEGKRAIADIGAALAEAFATTAIA